MKKHYLLIVIAILFTAIGNANAQKRSFIDNLTLQDTSMVENQRTWVSLGVGLPFASNPEGIDVLALGGSLDFTHINENYRLWKYKVAAYSGISLFDNFAQTIGECNVMSGKIYARKNYTAEFYYGIGIIGGQKRSGIISSSSGGSRGFTVSLPHTEYEKQMFLSPGIPLEFKNQWRVIGVGFDANLNLYLPYFGLKCFAKIGKDYRIKPQAGI